MQTSPLPPWGNETSREIDYTVDLGVQKKRVLKLTGKKKIGIKGILLAKPCLEITNTFKNVQVTQIK